MSDNLTEEQAIAEIEEATENKDEEIIETENFETTIKRGDKQLEEEFNEEFN